jgi:hypothetical protein
MPEPSGATRSTDQRPSGYRAESVSLDTITPLSREQAKVVLEQLETANERNPSVLRLRAELAEARAGSAHRYEDDKHIRIVNLSTSVGEGHVFLAGNYNPTLALAVGECGVKVLLHFGDSVNIFLADVKVEHLEAIGMTTEEILQN